MTKTLLRAGALSRALSPETDPGTRPCRRRRPALAGALALLATSALTAPGMAQELPRFSQEDANGVDLITGQFFFSLPEGSIGSGEGALTLVRNWAGSAGWTDNWTGTLYSDSAGEMVVEFGTYVDTFTYSGWPIVYTATKGDGASLEILPDSTFRYRSRDGTTIIFSAIDVAYAAEYQGPACARSGGSGCGIPIQIKRPDGMTYILNWDFERRSQDGGWIVYPRFRGVTNSANYSFTVNYATNTPGSGPPVANWYVRTGAQFTNLDGAPASLPTVTYSPVSSTVLDVTNIAGDTWRLTTAASAIGIRRPGSGADNVSATLSSGLVTQVVRDGVTTGYSRSVSGSTITTTVTQIDGDPGTSDPQTVVVGDSDVGRITSVTDPLSRQTSFQYDGSDRLTRVTEPEGNYVQYGYDARGNITETRMVAKSGSGLPDMVTTASYDSTCSNVVTCNQPNSVTDARGNVTDFTYDSTHGGMLTATAPAPSGSGDRPQTRYSYTQVTAVTGQPVYLPTAVSACASGSASGSPSCVGTANESRVTTAYDTDNLRRTSITRRNGDNSLSATNAYTYDAIGNLLTVDGPLSGTADTARFRYNAGRQAVGAIGPDPDGAGALKHRAVRATYTNGRPTRVERGTVDSQSDGDWAAFASLEETQQDYDANARPVVQRQVSGSTTYALTQTSYDALGRVQCTARRMNPSEFASLPSDACTLDTQGSFGPDRIARTTYDAAGQVAKVEAGYGVSGVAADEVAATYRANGRVETVTDANGNKTTYVYDGHDRLSRTRMPDPSTPGTSSTTDYEELTYATASGGTFGTPLAASRRHRDGRSVGYSYDALGRLAVRDLPTGEWDVTYSYDLLGRLTQAIDAGSFVAQYGYDALGRVVSEGDTYSGPLTYQYDLAGRRTRLTFVDSNYVAYVYDVAGGMTEVRENGATSGAGLLAVYAYDDLGRRTSLTRGNGTATSYAYDNVSRLSGLTQNLNGSTNDVTFGYSYNSAGEIASNTRSNDAYSFTLANANVAGTANGLNQLTAYGGASVTHDANGNVNAVGAASYSYYVENGMATASAISGGYLFYDPVGRLSFISDPADGAGVNARQYSGHELVQERTVSGAVRRRYVFGAGTDEPLVWYEGSSLSDRRWLHADERGSVIAASDGSGNLVGAINRYDDYGSPQGGAITGRFGYTGQVWIPEIGMYDYRARAYNPALGGRFMQTDPIGYEGGMNLYAYVGNNPVNFTDPTGLQEECSSGQAGCPEDDGQEVFVDGPLGRPGSGGSGTGFGGNIPDYNLPLDEFAENNVEVVGTRPPRPRPAQLVVENEVTVIGIRPPQYRNLILASAQPRRAPRANLRGRLGFVDWFGLWRWFCDRVCARSEPVYPEDYLRWEELTPEQQRDALRRRAERSGRGN